MGNLYLDGNQKKIFLKWEENAVAIIFTGLFIFGFLMNARNPFKIDDMNEKALLYIQQNYPQVREKVEIHGDPYFTSALSTDEDMPWWDGRWHIHLRCPSDDLLHFYIILDRKGDVVFDGYKDFYLPSGTVYEKFSWEYEIYFSRIFEKYYSDEDKGKFIITGFNNAQGVAGFGDGHYSQYDRFDIDGIDASNTYTMEQLAAQHGWLQFTFNDDEPTAENMVKRLEEARIIISKNSIPCKSVRIWLGKTATMQTDNIDEFMNSDPQQYVKENMVNIKEELKGSLKEILFSVPRQQ